MAVGSPEVMGEGLCDYGVGIYLKIRGIISSGDFMVLAGLGVMSLLSYFRC